MDLLCREAHFRGMLSTKAPGRDRYTKSPKKVLNLPFPWIALMSSLCPLLPYKWKNNFRIWPTEDKRQYVTQERLCDSDESGRAPIDLMIGLGCKVPVLGEDFSVRALEFSKMQ